MENGDFIVLDATNVGNTDIAKYRKLVRTYRYTTICAEDANLVTPSFNKDTNQKTYQIHGHRNPENLPQKTAEPSTCALEKKVS